MPSQKKHTTSRFRQDRHTVIVRLNGIEMMEGRCLLSVSPLGTSDISGEVFHDVDNDGVRSVTEAGIANVLITLQDQNERPVSLTLTDHDGMFQFEGVAPGTYTVKQTQPVGWQDGKEAAADSLAVPLVEPTGDDAFQIELVSGVHAENLSFGEFREAKIAGSVHQSHDEENCFSADAESEAPIDGALLQLINEDGVVVRRTTTDAQGEYVFSQVEPGTYSILQTTADSALKPNELEEVVVKSGSDLSGNDFCHVPLPDVTSFDTPPPVTIHGEPVVDPSGQGQRVDPHDTLAPPAVQIDSLSALPPFEPVLAPLAPRIFSELSIDVGVNISTVDKFEFPQGYSPQPIPLMATTFTPRTQELWRLVLLEIDASNNKPDEDDVSPFRKASFQRQRMPQVDMAHARRVPIAGDFDGDGIDELGFFSDGDWFIDLNHNDRPDRNDLWIRLGKVGSTPLTGDWDGDGKCDVGVFDGQERSQDSSPEDSATEMETKNRDDLAEVAKTSPIGAARLKIEAIDRVFQFGKAGQQPVAGDWNGNGTTTIGVFTDGVWQLDLDGSGHWSSSDKQATFGAAGDVAYVGDFNGDGLADLAVLRDGVLIIDSNGNHELDSSDQRISAGSAEGAVVIGDFNGDGRDEVRVAESHGMRQAG